MPLLPLLPLPPPHRDTFLFLFTDTSRFLTFLSHISQYLSFVW